MLDEALKMMKASEKMSVGNWIDLMSGKNVALKSWKYWYITSEAWGLVFFTPHDG